VAFTYLKVKSAKCLCLLPVVLILVLVLLHEIDYNSLKCNCGLHSELECILNGRPCRSFALRVHIVAFEMSYPSFFKSNFTTIRRPYFELLVKFVQFPNPSAMVPNPLNYSCICIVIWSIIKR